MPARGVFQGNLSNTGSRVLEMLTSSKAITASHALEAKKLTVGNVGANGIPVYFQNGLPVTDSSTKAVVNWVTANSSSIGGSTGSEAATAAAVQGIMQASGSWNSSSAWVGANSASLLSRTSSLSITASLGAPTAVSISYSPNGGNKAINIKIPSNPGHIGAASASHNHTIAQVTGLGSVTDSVKRLESSSSTYVTTASFNTYTSSADGKYLSISGGTISGNLVVSNDLTVRGTTVSIDAVNLNVKDKLILVASGSTTRAAADGAGLAVPTASAGEGGAARIQYENAGNRFTSSVNFAAPGFTGSLQGNVKGTASYALEADYAVSSSQAQEANHAVSSSEALHAASATSATYASGSTSASYASNAGSALTASYLIGGASMEVTNAKTASYVAWNNVANKPNYSASFVTGAFAAKIFNPYSGNQTINIPTQPGHVGAAPASHTHSISQVTGLSAISTSVADMSSHTSSWNNVANTASAAYTAASQALATASVAQVYAESASTYAANASASMQNARTYATNANTALTQANAASSSAKSAATAANTASGSAKNAATAANEASASAKTATTTAQNWAASSSTYATQAQTYRNAASASASVAHTAKTQAEASASAASQSAATAATYATAASASSGVVYQKAQEASASAAAAAGSATTAASARDAANTASGSAKTSATTATNAATAANNASASAKSAQTAANNASASAMAYATNASASAALLYKATGSATQPVYISADGPTPATAYSAASVKEAVTASNVAVAAVNTNANLPVLIAAAATPANPTPVKYDTNLTYNASTNRMNVQQVSATGLTGSLRGNVVGNVTGTASWATSASEAVHAITSSYALVAASVMDGAGLTVESASYATSASYANNSTTSSFALDHYKPTTATGSAIGTTAARTYIKAINVDKNNHVISVTTGSETVTNTDTKVTAVGNHYTPAQSTGKAASAGSVISGLGLDAKGHVVAVTGSNSITSASFATNAAQLGGKAANQYASASHTHEYATPAQVTGSLGAYLPLAGGTVTGDLTVQGNAIFNGTASFINTTDLVVKDRLILLASGSANTASANGAGIAVQTASATTVAAAEGAAARIQYLSAGNKFTSSVRFEAPQIGVTGITGSLLGTASRAISASRADSAASATTATTASYNAAGASALAWVTANSSSALTKYHPLSGSLTAAFKAGGVTSSAEYEVSGAAGKNQYYRVTGNSHSIGFGIGTGNTNRGIYQFATGSGGVGKTGWLLLWDNTYTASFLAGYRVKADGFIGNLQGTATTASKLVNAGTTGSSRQPVYYNAGKLAACTGYTVTAAQTASWDAKQAAISDLATIRTNAASGNVAFGWGNHANAGYVKSADITTAVNNLVTASGSVWSTDNDTKVTAVDNHYAPTASTEIAASITGSAGAFATNTEYTVLTGIKAKVDAKGHITDIKYTAQKVKDTTIANTDRYVATASFASTGSAGANGVKMTLTRRGSDTGTVVATIPVASTSAAGVVTGAQVGKIESGSTAFGWGNHANAGYVKSADITTAINALVTTSGSAWKADTDRYVNTASFASTGSNGANGVKMTLTRKGSDTATVVATIPVASATAAGVVTGAQVGKIESGSVAFGWGNHANAGYLKSTGTIATASYNAAGATALAWITSNSASALKNDATTYAGHYTPSASGATAKGSSAARTYLKTVSVDGKGHVVGFTTGSETVTNTDTKVTAVGNHYTPAQSAGKSVSAGQVMVGVGVDAAGHVVAVTGSSAITASCLGVAANTSASVAAAINAKWTYSEATIKGVKVNNATAADSATTATKLAGTSGSLGIPVYINAGVPTACNANIVSLPLSSSGATTGTLTLVPGKVHKCGTLTGDLTLALGTDNTYTHEAIYCCVFNMGATVRTITLPSGVKVMENSVDLDTANCDYEINIMNNVAVIARTREE